MNLSVVGKWAEALRSGEYKQGVGYLRRGDCYCPLGVLCDLYIKEFGGDWALMWSDLSGDVFAPLDSNTFLLPLKVQDWVGMHNFGDFPLNDTTTVTDLNDSGVVNFAAMAAALEKVGEENAQPGLL